jgi:hypothetical protein
MLVKTIIDSELGKKWEIYKADNDKYYYRYYEHFDKIGWKFLSQEGGTYYYYDKDAIELALSVVI